MGAAAVNTCERPGRAWKSEYIVLTAGLLLMLLVLSRYIVNGEPVDVRSDEAAVPVALFDGMEIVQPLTITEEMDWRQGYYALYFAECDPGSSGQVICTVKQEETLGTAVIPLSEIRAGEWTRLDGLDFGKLECGEAVLCLSSEGVRNGELAVAAGPDHYGFGTMGLNGERQELTLLQAYHYHITGMEYRVRLLCYGVVALCAAALALLTFCRRIGSRIRCLTVFGVMTVMFMAVIYILDSSIYLEPTYAEAVTNFLQNAREAKITANLLITDAGYLPLLPRLITLFYVKALRLPPAYVLYFMQATACLLCSMVWSFFTLYPFEKFMRLHNRILWCILVMLTCFCEETLFFTNHAYWGIYLLLLLLVVDLEYFPRWIYAVLVFAGAVVCLSKGTYVVMVPLMMFYLFLFQKSIGKRHKVFARVIGIASLLQLLYSFSGQGDGGRWIDTASMGQIGYWARLIGRVFAEFAAYLLAPLGRYVRRIPGFVLLSATVIFIFAAVDFIRTVLIPFVKRERIAKSRVAFYTVVMFQLIVSAFYLVTVRPVPDSWSGIGKVVMRQMGHKYEIFSNAGFYMLLLTGTALLKTGNKGAKRGTKAVAVCGRYGVLALFFLFCLTNPVMKLTGWTDAETSDRRVYAGDINAGWRECRDFISEYAFFIPVRADNWGYSRNATIYQVGTETYFEEVSGINLEETVPGYHDVYELKDTASETQNVIEVMIDRPVRIDRPICRVQLLDEEDNVIAEAGQVGAGRNKKCLFRFDEPVNGVKTMRFTDADGAPVYYKDYIAWVCAW